MRLEWCMLCLLSVVSLAGAQEHKATVEIIADSASIAPAKPLTVALHFKIQPGWHLYWQNPGDTGAPPKVKWNLPEGFTAGPLEFPVPKRIDLPGGLTAFGYEDDLVLLTTITPPDKVEQSIDISGKVSWVVCKDVCIAERQEIALKLPNESGTGDREADFKRWREQQPTRASAGLERVPTVTMDTANAKRGLLTFALRNGEKPIDFFPPAADFLTFEKPVTRYLGERGEFQIPFTILPGDHERMVAPGVLVIELSGHREAIEVPCTFDFAK